MSAPTGDDSYGGVEVAVAGDDQEIMTSAMLRKRVVTLCNAGDYQLALEIARLAQKGNVGKPASTEAAHVDVEDAGHSATGSIAEGAPADANDIMLAEIIALLEEKVSFAAEDEEEDDSDSDGEEVEADEDEDESEDSQTDEDESDDDDEATR